MTILSDHPVICLPGPVGPALLLFQELQTGLSQIMSRFDVPGLGPPTGPLPRVFSKEVEAPGERPLPVNRGEGEGGPGP